MHSECLTSEVFGSLKCDCRQQLDAAKAEIARRGFGVVLYLRQEGRGIGLANKIRAYALQALGADTVEANELLHLPVDARQYDVAAAMLRELGVESIELMTNNPAKVDSPARARHRGRKARADAGRRQSVLGAVPRGQAPPYAARDPEQRAQLGSSGLPTDDGGGKPAPH